MDFASTFKKLINSGSKCVYCGRETVGTQSKWEVCTTCDAKLKEYYNKDNNKEPYHVYAYDGIVKKLIFRLKYDGKVSLALYIGEEIFDKYKKSGIVADIVTYVPIHEKRLAQRGFDQSEQIAVYFATFAQIPMHTLLKRTINTKPQYSLATNKRSANVYNAFVFTKEADVKNKSVLIIDDIYTTGATALECKKTLVSQGAEVFIFTFAMDVLRI